MKLTLKTKFVLTTVLLVVTGLTVSTVFSIANSNKTIGSISEDQKRRLVGVVQSHIDTWIQDRKLEIRYWGKLDVFSVVIDGAFHKMANKELAELVKDYDFYYSLNIADNKGDIIASSDSDTQSGKNISSREWFNKAREGDVVFSDVFTDAQRRPVFVIAGPVMKEGTPVGVITGAISLEYFNRHFVSPVRFGKTGFIFVLDNDCKIIGHPDSSRLMTPGGAVVRAMPDQKGGTVEYTEGGTDKIAACSHYEELQWFIVTTADKSEILAPGKNLGTINFVIALCVIALAVAVAVVFSRSIVKPIYRAIDSLGISSDQINGSAQEVSSASQTLAHSTSEQASSLEETAASLEELSSMAQRNSDSSHNVRELVNKTAGAARDGAESMQKLMMAMEGINESASQITSITQAIEEIAFQTNLLSLNAAVEAARAGETGRGFAVVADEVRTLAQRSAEQAKETSKLISESVNRTTEGTRQANEANQALENILNSIKKVEIFTDEIASASNDQAQGITQINSTVAQMDKIVQNTSASAEESASASQHMAAQAEELKDIVRSLIRIVEGVNVKNIQDSDQSSEFQCTDDRNSEDLKWQLNSG